MRLSTLMLTTMLFAFSVGAAQSPYQSSFLPCRQDKSKSVSSPCANEAQTAIPENWQKITIEGKFSFRLPPEMKQTNVSGVESLMREYKSDKMRVYFVHEPYSYLSHDSRMLEGKKDYREVVFKIDGKPATLFSYSIAEDSPLRFMTELYVGDWAHDEVELIMVAETQNAANLDTAKMILKSVCFAKHCT
jgi:hypothetical protein